LQGLSGEQMQIHELTSRGPRSINENLLTTLAKDVAKNVGASAMSALTGQAPDKPEFVGNRVSKALRPEQALDQTYALLMKTVDPAVDSWMYNLQQMMASSNPPVTSVAQLDQQKINLVIKGMINDMLGVNDYTQLLDTFEKMTTVDGPEPGRTVAQYATTAGTAIKQAIDELMQLTGAAASVDLKTKSKQPWYNIIMSGVHRLMHLNQFYGNAGGSQTAAPASAGSTSNWSPAVLQLIQASGITSPDSFKTAVGTRTVSKTGHPLIDEFLKYVGVKLT